MKFKRYSEVQKGLKEKFYSSSIKLKSWNNITLEEKELIFKHFQKKNWFQYDDILTDSLDEFVDEYKRIDIGLLIGNEVIETTFNRKDRYFKALKKIFFKLDEFFLLEFLSIYIVKTYENDKRSKNYINFQNCCVVLFDDFGINKTIINQQFVPKQSEKIMKEIYEPTLYLLQCDEFKLINEEINKAFNSFNKHEYGDSITKSINSIHLLLQLLIDGKPSKKRNLSTLIAEAQKKKIISNLDLISKIYDSIESYLARIRKEKSGVHPTTDKAEPKDALFVLNLTMVLIQNIISK